MSPPDWYDHVAFIARPLGAIFLASAIGAGLADQWLWMFAMAVAAGTVWQFPRRLRAAFYDGVAWGQDHAVP